MACSSGRFYAIQEAGAIARFDSSGAHTLEPRPPPTQSTAALTGIFGNSLGQIWVTGLRGQVLHYDGATWRYVDVGTTEDLYGVWVAPNSTRPWLVGSNGLVLRRR
jgi:streptogramin lyase